MFNTEQKKRINKKITTSDTKDYLAEIKTENKLKLEIN